MRYHVPSGKFEGGQFARHPEEVARRARVTAQREAFKAEQQALADARGLAEVPLYHWKRKGRAACGSPFSASQLVSTAEFGRGLDTCHGCRALYLDSDEWAAVRAEVMADVGRHALRHGFPSKAVDIAFSGFSRIA